VVQKKEALTSDNSLNLFVKTEDEVRDSAKVEITEGGETRILYLPKVGIVQMDKLFWKHVAGRCGLRLTEIDPQYKGKEPLTPWYTAMHKESGVVLTLGTRNSVYAVKAEFPEAKGAAQLRELVDGLHVNPQTVDGQWIGPKMPSGRQFETHIDLGLGNEVVAYIDRLLGNTDLAPALSK
ncbi:MAG TPA: hypothetical protein VI612_02530, partial [Candidatus Nanoarchaeia archaeon]|nr:hypothetical protein [Candidatus Nanoarchaeia archaeon]